MYAESFDTLINSATRLKGMVPKSQLAALAKLMPAIEKKAGEVPADAELRPVKKAFNTAFNLFASVRDGINNGEMSKKDYDGVIKDLQGLHKQVAAAEKPKVEKETAEEKARRDELSDSGEGRVGAQTDDGHAVLQKYNRFRQLVPAKLEKRFTAIKVPVLPITDPMMRKDRLGKLCTDKFFDYPILLNQTLIGLQNDWIRREFKHQTKPAIAEVVELLASQTKRNYVPLGSFKVRNDVTWVWVATDREYELLQRAVAGGRFRVMGWDFPFEYKPK